MLATIKSKRPLCNYCEDRLGPQYLQQSKRSEAMWRKLGDEQKNGSILIVPCQSGLRHRGRSVRRAREVMNASEFGLGAFAVGVMLLTHPERLKHYDDLWIDCAGDEYSTGAGGLFGMAPCFDFDDGGVRFGARWCGYAGGRCGSASGFQQ